jgi:hypothetical protein
MEILNCGNAQLKHLLGSGAIKGIKKNRKWVLVDIDSLYHHKETRKVPTTIISGPESKARRKRLIDESEGELCTLEDAGKALRVGRGRVRSLIDEGQLKGMRDPEDLYWDLVYVQSLHDLIERRKGPRGKIARSPKPVMNLCKGCSIIIPEGQKYCKMCLIERETGHHVFYERTF